MTQIANNPISLLPAVQDFLRRPKRLFINNAFVEPASGKTMPTEDPASGDVLDHIPAGDAADVDLAVRAARKAFEGEWRAMSPTQRAACMFKLADLIEQHAEEFAEIESLDVGKTITSARAIDVPFTVYLWRYYAGWATKLYGKTLDLSLPPGDTFFSYVRREPVGVVGCIIPWNYPLAQVSFKIAPALAAGCTTVVKPAEQASLANLRLAELIAEAGFPAGAVNIVTGLGETAGAALAEHPDVNKISFTGSTAVGKLIMQAAGRSNLKRLTLELGGKSPTIVFADASMDEAIPTAAAAIFNNSGQVCNAGSRLYVQRSAFERVLEGVADYARHLQIGVGLDERTQLGPLVTREQKARVLSYMQQGLEGGARPIVGGPDLLRDVPGNFVHPTIFVNTTAEMSIVREEIFGPVLVAMPFDDPDEIAPVANQTHYGLAATIFTRDISRAHKLAARLNAGAIWINCFGVFDPNLPFGGFKQSGMGREFSQEGIEAFTELKAVTVKL
ncbi:MAG: aldehyde dehydrogenase family protein [Anaerolineae bacterium]|nr:aldehyde dehydrogenase family protein [Anaerolineae bacterium]